jgi:hypothetical protein
MYESRSIFIVKSKTGDDILNIYGIKSQAIDAMNRINADIKWDIEHGYEPDNNVSYTISEWPVEFKV